MGDRPSVEALQWLAYIGESRNNVTHAGTWREFRLDWLTNLKINYVI
jgi:hypothetical protein